MKTYCNLMDHIYTYTLIYIEIFLSFLTEHGCRSTLHLKAWHSKIFNKCQVNFACRTVEFKCYPYVFPVTSEGVVTNVAPKEDL